MAKATLPTGPWTFDADVANCFPDMLRRSIPGYNTKRHDPICYLVEILHHHEGIAPVLYLGARSSRPPLGEYTQ